MEHPSEDIGDDDDAEHDPDPDRDDDGHLIHDRADIGVFEGADRVLDRADDGFVETKEQEQERARDSREDHRARSGGSSDDQADRSIESG